jgi:hypothetical protein
MAEDFLDFYRSKGNSLSDIDIYYDFDTGILGESPVTSGFFESGNPYKPIVYNKKTEISDGYAVGENYSGFYDKKGTGNFIKNYDSESFLKINNSKNLSGSSNWTFIITANKYGTNNGIIFSSLSGDKGFNLGFNDAHNLYLESSSGIFVSELNYASYNGLVLNKNGSNFNIGRYNFNTNKFDVENFSINGVSHGENWFIGGTPNKQISESSFSGTIDNFVYFNKKINTTKLNSIFSGFLIRSEDSLGLISLTGTQTSQSGYVESGIKYIFKESVDISGEFTILKDNIPFNKDILKTGYISDFCGNRESLYRSGDKIGVKKGNFFLEYSGNFAESNIQTGLITDSSVVIRQLITGFQSQVTLSTGQFSDLVFEYNCLNDCGNIEPIFSFQTGIGIISGFNFIPITGLVSGFESTTVKNETLKEVFVSDVIDQSCGFYVDSGYIDQYGFDSIFIKKNMAPSFLNQSLVSPEDLNLNNTVKYNNTEGFFKIPQNDSNSNFFSFYNGYLQISGKNYDIKNNKITGSGLNSSGAFTYGNLSELKIKDISGSYTGTSKTSLLFTGDKNSLYSILTGSGSVINLPVGEYKAMEFNDYFEINSGDNNYLSFDKFFEKSSMVFLNGKKMLHSLDYLETPNNKRLKSGIFETKGDYFGDINNFFQQAILGKSILLEDGYKLLTEDIKSLNTQ